MQTSSYCAGGNYVAQAIAGHEEIRGPDVTMAQLLLENNVSVVVGRSAYALVTHSAAQQLGLPSGK